IARQAPALLLLHLEQPARQGAQALLREFQGMLRAQPLRDVVDEDQARGAAAPAHQVADAFDIDWLAAALHVAEHAAVHRPGFAAQELAERLAILGTADVLHHHREEFLARVAVQRSEEHTSELQSRENLVCRLLLEKKKNKRKNIIYSKF